VFDETTLQFLSRPLIARLSTLGADSYPHTVPVWFDLEHVDGDVQFVMVSDRSARKTRNAERDQRAALMIGGGLSDDDGYLIRGDLTIVGDDGHVVTHRMIDRYEAGPRNAELRAAWKDDDIVVIRLRPRSVVRVLV
jgi:PPOX class probable F420-dependent enzyme